VQRLLAEEYQFFCSECLYRRALANGCVKKAFDNNETVLLSFHLVLEADFW